MNIGNREIPPTRENILTALSFISPSCDRDTWMRALAAIKYALGEDGRDMAESWSQEGNGYSKTDFRDTWKSIRPGGGITIATLWKMALDNGWKPDGKAYQETEAERLERERKQKARDEKSAKAEQSKYAQSLAASRKILELTHEGPHPYPPAKGVRFDGRIIEAREALAVRSFGPPIKPDAGPLLILPSYRPHGELCGLQAIDPTGEKGFIAGGKKGRYILGTIESEKPIAIVEGLATGLSIQEATGYAVVIAFDAGGLVREAGLLATEFPTAPILVCGDLGNGQDKAERAALETGAALALPTFTPEQIQAFQAEHGKPPTDFNDLHQIAGPDEVGRQVAAALDVAAHDPAEPAQEAAPEPFPPKPRRKKPDYSTKPLIYLKDDNPDHPRLVKQSKAAKILKDKLDDLTYDPVRQCWLQFQGGMWKHTTDTQALGAIMDAIDRNGGDDVGYDSAYPGGIAIFLKSRLCADGFDQNPDLIPFKNGVLDRRTGILSAHDKAHRLTWQLPYSYVPDATCAPVIDWLGQCVGGDLDQVETLRAFIRAVLMGRADLQRYLELQGPPGSGKGTFLRLVAAVVGERNMHTTTMKQLETNRFEVANLYGKRLVQITDAEKYVGDTAMLKAITGEDYLPYEAKHRQGGESFKFGGLVLIAANDATTTGDYAGALHRRRITVRFDHVIDPTQRRQLDEEFAPFIPGVINWALAMDEGRMVDLLRDTDRQVAALAEANLRNLLEVNPVAAWAAESLIAAPGHETNVGVKQEVTITDGDGTGRRESQRVFKNADLWLYANYATWCLENSRNDLGLKKFSNALASVIRDQFKVEGIALLDNSNGKGKRFQGVKLRTVADIGKPGIAPIFQNGSAREKNECSTARTLKSMDSMDGIENLYGNGKRTAQAPIDEGVPDDGGNFYGEKSTGTRSIHTVRTINDLSILHPYCTRAGIHTGGPSSTDEDTEADSWGEF